MYAQVFRKAAEIIAESRAGYDKNPEGVIGCVYHFSYDSQPTHVRTRRKLGFVWGSFSGVA